MAIVLLCAVAVEQFIDDCRIAPGTLDADNREVEDVEAEVSVVESSLT